MQTLTAFTGLRASDAVAGAAPPALSRLPGRPVAVADAAPVVLTAPNPTLRLDASLGLVVLEFRNAGGEPRTIPSQRELDAYRNAARGAAPGREAALTAGGPSAGAPSADVPAAGAPSAGAPSAGALADTERAEGAVAAGALTAGALTAGALTTGALSPGAAAAGALAAGREAARPVAAAPPSLTRAAGTG